MSNNDIDLYQGGALQPSGGSLAPSPAAGGQIQRIDHIGTGRQVQQHQQGTPATTFFGQPVTNGATTAQLEEFLAQAQNLYVMDFNKLKHPAKWISASVAWLSANCDLQCQPEPKRHNYNLHELADDPLMNNWANQVSRVGASQKFVSDTVWYVGELTRRLNAEQAPQGRAPAAANNFGSPDPNNYTDAQWTQILKANEQAATATEIALRNKYGASYLSVIAQANAQLARLPAKEQQHLQRLTAGGVAGINTVEVVEGLYLQSIGGGTLPKNGQNIAAEIASIENVMRTNRKAYVRDEQMQARYRHLLDMRGN